ncbi:MAG: hypothetical protein IJ367_00025 [Clostridia bacterium]|nr:hypothetical protein [Clostridia bacterium]
MKVLAFGEILFDCYPTDRKIGGAPLNFCAHLAKLGAEVSILSAIGKDSNGEEAVRIVKEFGVDTRYLQVSSHFPTGMCRVTYCEGEPQYELVYPSAYDRILENEKIYEESFDVFYFGTLASRGETSQMSLQKLLKKGNFEQVFFDMNLRQNFYSEELVTDGLLASDIVKMNRDEFAYVKEISGILEQEYDKA